MKFPPINLWSYPHVNPLTPKTFERKQKMDGWLRARAEAIRRRTNIWRQRSAAPPNVLQEREIRERKIMQRHCPCCGGPLMLLSSYRSKVCYDCRRSFTWELEPGQQPLVKATR